MYYIIYFIYTYYVYIIIMRVRIRIVFARVGHFIFVSSIQGF